MKRVVALLLVLVFMFTACGSEASGPKTLEEFIEKYKREDWSSFTTNVGVMMDEFSSVFAKGGEWSTKKDAYNPEVKTNGWIDYVAVIILFNQPFELTVFEHNGTEASGGLRYECLKDDCFELCLAVFENIAKRKGDPTTIEINDTATTEADFRKAISEGIDEGSITIRWGVVEENNAFTISCYRYSGQKGWLSLY